MKTLTQLQFKNWYEIAIILLTNPPKAEGRLKRADGMCCLGVALNYLNETNQLQGAWTVDTDSNYKFSSSSKHRYRANLAPLNDYSSLKTSPIMELLGCPANGLRIPTYIVEKYVEELSEADSWTYFISLTKINDDISSSHVETGLIILEYLFSEHVQVKFVEPNELQADSVAV